MSLLGTKYDSKNIGLYRDDGLSIFRNVSGPKLEKIKKHIQKIFKGKILDVIIECNTKIVNYLDAIFNLSDGTYKPCKKPNDETKYIQVDSDHPPSIIKQIPKSIETRLSSLSSSKEIFLEAAQYYEQNLASCGYKEKLTYVEQSAKKTEGNKKRKRNIIWFNPPYSKTVKTNIGKQTNKHFPPEHKFHKIFNKNTLKLSYSCIPNLKTLINSHNQNILGDQPQSTPKTWNCLRKEDCPMNGLCLTKTLLYYATITCDKENYTKLYKGICETTLKKRYANHKKSFNVPNYKNDTKLSTEYWALKTKQVNPKLSWQIKRR